MENADLDGVLGCCRQRGGKPQCEPRRGGEPTAGNRSLGDRTDYIEHRKSLCVDARVRPWRCDALCPGRKGRAKVTLSNNPLIDKKYSNHAQACIFFMQSYLPIKYTDCSFFMLPAGTGPGDNGLADTCIACGAGRSHRNRRLRCAPRPPFRHPRADLTVEPMSDNLPAGCPISPAAR